MQPAEHHQTTAEPRNHILRTIDNMGELLAEYPVVTTYWFREIAGWLCACAMLITMAIIGPSMLAELGKINPGEVPGGFVSIMWVLTILTIGIPVFVMIYLIRQTRKQPLLFGLFEKGLVVVCRNKTYRQVFWNDISRFRVITHGKKPPRVIRMTLEISMPEQKAKSRGEFIFADIFCNGEELCQRILDATPLTEKDERPTMTRREIYIFLGIMAVAILFMICMHVWYGPYYRTHGSVSKNWQIKSKMTGETMRFSVYLPPGYYSENKYPVLYILHGFRDDHTSWLEHGELRRIADEAISSGKIAPMVIVMPHTLGGFYGNRQDGGYRYEDYFFTELIPCIEERLRVHRGKENRAIAGISMGGQGAFYYAMKYPQSFTACCPMGGAFNFTDLGSVQIHREIPKDAANDLGVLLQKTAERYATNDLLVRQNELVRFYFDCGEQDGLININRNLDAKMQKLGIPHDFRTRLGGHDWQCWQDALPDVLEFVSAEFGK